MANGFTLEEVNISFPVDGSETARGLVDGFMSGISNQVEKLKTLDDEGATILIMTSMVIIGWLYIWRRV
tara:strand:+ start:12748 stop:12954 length:207 start_codon:yes stop_codon:yes gene_type:complete